MSVDINLANYQAGQLRNYSLQLNGVVDSLKNYKSTIDINWQGNEVKLIDNAIDKINRRIQNLQQNMNSTANNIINSANQIRQEEIQAEQRRQAEIENEKINGIVFIPQYKTVYCSKGTKRINVDLSKGQVDQNPLRCI